jgi:tRNA dimethylallyltransferase
MIMNTTLSSPHNVAISEKNMKMIADKHLLVLSGPTAIGKSRVAMELAQQLNTVILSTDSRQLYREMNIGTAKPSAIDLQQIQHFFINHIHIWESYTAAKFEKEALQLLEALFKKYRVVIACGGTGFYIHALCEGLDLIPEVPEATEQHFAEELKRKGLAALAEQLQSLDPEYSQQADLKNPRRVLRALSVIKATGKTFSEFHQNKPKPRPFQVHKLLLEMDRADLYDRINQRVDHMLEAGLEEEAKSLLPYADLTALQTVGYQEWFPYFEGIRTKAEVVRLIKRNSRRYAKRQMTWFRNRTDWNRFHIRQKEEILAYALSI